jgi:hypothetical protein
VRRPGIIMYTMRPIAMNDSRLTLESNHLCALKLRGAILNV